MASQGWAVLRHRDFALLCGIRTSVTLASNITHVAIGWYVYEVTSDPFALAYLGLAGFLPAVLLVLFSGYAADRIDRRELLLIANTMLSLLAVALLAAVWAFPGLIWPIYVFVMLKAAARSFSSASSQALLPNLVPKAELSNAIAFNSGAFQAATIAGPALGGLLYAVDSYLPFAIAALFMIAATIATVAIRHRMSTASQKPPVTLESLFAGFTFAWSKPVVFGAISLDAMVVLLGGLVILLPIYAKDILDVGPSGLGLLRSAPAVGAFLMALWLARDNFARRNTATRLFQTIAVFGLATIVFGFSESFLLSLAALCIVGAADMVSVVIRHTLVQADTPDEVRGRVTAVNQLFAASTTQLGDFRAGIVAGFLGPVFAAVSGGAAIIALAVIWPWLFRELRERDYLVEEDRKREAK